MYVLDTQEEKKIIDQSATYYLTFTIISWIDLFTRKRYRDIVVDALNHCISRKSLKVNAWVIMSNHIHLIASSSKEDLSGTIRDFKKHTSKEIIKSIQSLPESRREWLLRAFKHQSNKNTKNKQFQLWQQKSYPVELISTFFFEQKLNYIHNNPVEAGIVYEPHDYIYSSAIDYCGGKGLVEIETI